MKRNRLVATGVATAMTLAFALSACSSDSGSPADPTPGPTTPSEDTPPEPAEITFWVIGGDTNEELRTYLKSTFEAENEGSTLNIVERTWADIITELTTKLGDPTQTPDVTEMGNTQAPTFTNVGAFLDISDMYEELGGDKLLQSFVEIGSVDDKLFAVPYYAGSRFVFYNTEMWGETPIPETLTAFGDAVISLNKPGEHGGLNIGGADWRNGVSWIWAYGGELAELQDGKWVSTLNTPEAIEGLTEYARVFQGASNRAATDNDADYHLHLNNGEAASVLGANWTGCCLEDIEFGVFNLPNVAGDGVAPAFAGGSNLAISAKSQHPELAKNLLRIIFSEEYQIMLAEVGGMSPANTDYHNALGETESANASKAAMLSSKLSPAAVGWADVEQAAILETLFTKVAEGGDVAAAAAEADAAINAIING